MIDIILNEWKGLRRSRLLSYLFLFFAASLVLVAWLGIAQNQHQRAEQQKAHAHVRAQWDNMGPSNPHGAAHFGSYAFKPVSALHNIDEGVNAVTGNVLRLEGHVQNEPAYSEASQSKPASRFGKLKTSLVLQFLIPLCLIFLAFNSYAQEKQSGRLKLLLLQGSSIRQLLIAKTLSVWIIGLAMLLLALAVQLALNLSSLNADSVTRLGLLFAGYASYFFVLCALAVLLSAQLKQRTASLALMLAVWILWTVFLPRIVGTAVERLHPLPTRAAFQKAMAEDRAKGIDGHNPSGDREKELETQTLAKYGADSLSQLPINFDGLVMQADEDYGNLVWDKHFGDNYTQLQAQKSSYQLSGILNPFASLQSISMGAAGTDIFHHLDFLRQAEDYRRVLIKALNDKHAFGGAKTGDWDWEADAAFFQSIADFDYTTPRISQQLAHYALDLVGLLAWALLGFSLLYFTSNRISPL